MVCRSDFFSKWVGLMSLIFQRAWIVLDQTRFSNDQKYFEFAFGPFGFQFEHDQVNFRVDVVFF